MRPTDIAKLNWRRPRNMGLDDFSQLQPQLIDALGNPQGREVYAVNTRSIYRLDDPQLGSIAIKELRFETRFRRLQAATLRRHRVLCEFHAAACFAHKGGVTPRLLGAAIEGSPGRLDRLFILLDWLAEAVTLSEALGGWSKPVFDHNIVQLAQALVAAAKCGLVHGRHSSENILVTQPLTFHVIDFSHAQIFDSFQVAGFIRDVARIGARLIIEGACSEQRVTQLFDAVVQAVADGKVSGTALNTEFDKVLNHSKRRQRLARNWHTLWRGFPSRLRD